MVEIALDDAIADELERKAGVRVSSQWLSACLAHLRETNQHVTADAVLHQILHSDLRDVVQRDNDDGVLRQALSQDKAKVPESFILMVQVEELLDVSLNAEARLQVGPASATAPTPVGNQRLRCLKLYLSDGYKQTTQHIVAMEILPLQDLSVNSKAGIKVILRGSTTLTCRHGILMCSPGNAQVLGGCVSSLMEIQRKALEQAKKVAGVGVDPTVKALIWNPLGAEEEGGGKQHNAVVDFPANHSMVAYTLLCLKNKTKENTRVEMWMQLHHLSRLLHVMCVLRRFHRQMRDLLLLPLFIVILLLHFNNLDNSHSLLHHQIFPEATRTRRLELCRAAHRVVQRQLLLQQGRW